jgi:hypothetical protein
MTNKTQANEYLVLAGIASDDKPHAARFPASEIVAVRKAAGLMSMRVGKATDEAALKVARKLPEGRIFAAGKAFVPLVKAALYDELLKAVTLYDASGTALPMDAKPETKQDEGPVTSTPPPVDLWALIKVGTVVLCRDDSDEPAWWECVVMAIGKDGENLVMRWRDWPTLKSFSAQRHAVALVGPAAPAKAGKR